MYALALLAGIHVLGIIGGIIVLIIMLFILSRCGMCGECACDCCAIECCCDSCDCVISNVPMFLLGVVLLWGGGLAAVGWVVYSLVRA